MEAVKRLSMNTSLKNARIFDDDAWQELDGQEVQKEIKTEPETENNPLLQKCKTEPLSYSYREIKKEPEDCDTENDKKDPELLSENKYTNTLNLEDSCSNARDLVCKTPSPLHKIKEEPKEEVDDIFDESPYNKALFDSIRIKEETLTQTEDESGGDLRNSLKSAKRTVFNRLSPYKRFDNDVAYEKRLSAKSRLGPKVDDETERPRKQFRPSKDEIESDPAVLARRAKQIDYGKNTIGYDNYRKLVPRASREIGEPRTPNRHKKYSRREFDSLIRRWRIQLHRYDPEDIKDTEDENKEDNDTEDEDMEDKN